MKQLYARAAAGDFAGIKRITESAATPFQRALAIVSLEHVLIQQHQPELAGQYAKKTWETDSTCVLAKAEGLSALATEWFRALNDERARADFDPGR